MITTSCICSGPSLGAQDSLAPRPAPIDLYAYRWGKEDERVGHPMVKQPEASSDLALRVPLMTDDPSMSKHYVDGVT